MPVDISAIICSCDRPEFLDKALASVCAQDLAPDRFEIIVVDNGKQASAKPVVARHTGAHPMRLLRESQPGLSRSRNAGLAAAHGRVIAFLDDDAIAEPGWLAALLDIFDHATPPAGTVGGRVVPIWEVERPPWLVHTVTRYLSVLDLGRTVRVVPERIWFVGANIAFDRDALRAIGGFPEHLGRQGTGLMSGEETAVKRLLERSGYVSWYTPHAVVRHFVPAERMTQRWVLRRIFWQGVTDAHHVRDRLPLTPEERLGMRGYWREAAKIWNWHKLLLDYPAKGAFLRRTATAAALGYVLGRLRLVR